MCLTSLVMKNLPVGSAPTRDTPASSSVFRQLQVRVVRVIESDPPASMPVDPGASESERKRRPVMMHLRLEHLSRYYISSDVTVQVTESRVSSS